MVNPIVDVRTKTRDHRKILGKTQKNNNYWKPKE